MRSQAFRVLVSLCFFSPRSTVSPLAFPLSFHNTSYGRLIVVSGAQSASAILAKTPKFVCAETASFWEEAKVAKPGNHKLGLITLGPNFCDEKMLRKSFVIAKTFCYCETHSCALHLWIE